VKWLGITAVCAVVLALLGVGIGIALWWSNHSAQTVAVREQAVAANAAIAAGQARAETNAIQIQVAGQARDRIDLEVHEHNDQSISAAPGADAPVDPRLNSVGRRGLCQHPAYAADPECAGLQRTDPAQLPASQGPAVRAAGEDASW
jgi:hypothetical protein